MPSIIQIKTIIQQSIEAKQKLLEGDLNDLLELSLRLAKVLENGGKIMIAGNGGSAADAQHLAAEMLVRLRSEVNRDPLPVISLILDPSSITAHSNDYDFNSYFKRMLLALGKKGDAFLAITTSGNSKNILLALEGAKQKGIDTYAFLGGSGGEAKHLADHSIIVPSDNVARIQESHIMLGHIVMELIEDYLLGKADAD